MPEVGLSLVAPWWRICLPMQETWIQSYPWSQKILHTMEQLSPRAAPTEACAPQEEPLQQEARTLQLESSSCLPQLE